MSEITKIVIEDESLEIIKSLKDHFEVTFSTSGPVIVMEIRANGEYITSEHLYEDDEKGFCFYDHTKENLRGLKEKCERADEACAMLEDL